MNFNLEDKCGYYKISRSQREVEMNRGLGTKGTEGFEKTGCYDCDGYNKKCASYFSPLEEYNKGMAKWIWEIFIKDFVKNADEIIKLWDKTLTANSFALTAGITMAILIIRSC